MTLITLDPIPPFRLDLTVAALRRLPVNEMDRWDGRSYRRVFVLAGDAVEAEVFQTGSVQDPELTVRTPGRALERDAHRGLVEILERILGTNTDLRPFLQATECDPRLAALVGRFPGFKPPRLPSVFETMVNGVACQQVSLAAGIHLLNRLCRAYGPGGGDSHAFPRVSDLADATAGQLHSLGFSRRKAETILGIAGTVANGHLELEALASLDDAAALDRLVLLKGIGRWTAQYILLRGLGRLDMFPADDVGGQNKMQRWLGLGNRPTYDEMRRILAPWRPYRGLIYFYLLLDHQARMGMLGPSVSNA